MHVQLERGDAQDAHNKCILEEVILDQLQFVQFLMQSLSALEDTRCFTRIQTRDQAFSSPLAPSKYSKRQRSLFKMIHCLQVSRDLYHKDCTGREKDDTSQSYVLNNANGNVLKRSSSYKQIQYCWLCYVCVRNLQYTEETERYYLLHDKALMPKGRFKYFSPNYSKTCQPFEYFLNSADNSRLVK